MNNPQIIVPIVIAITVIALFIILRNRITGFKGRFSKRGVDVSVSAPQEQSAPAQGVDLAEAEFKDRNKFAADNEARVKAQKLKAGSGNTFQFGSVIRPAENDKSEGRQ